MPSSVTDTVAFPNECKLFVADFYSGETYNEKGREIAKILANAFKSKKYSVLNLSATDNEVIMKSGGINDYKQARTYGRLLHATYVCYGTIEKQDDKKFKITLKLFDVSDENIVTIKEAFISAN